MVAQIFAQGIYEIVQRQPLQKEETERGEKKEREARRKGKRKKAGVREKTRIWKAEKGEAEETENFVYTDTRQLKPPT